MLVVPPSDQPPVIGVGSIVSRAVQRAVQKDFEYGAA
jgi:hypothetical protein